MMPESQQLHTAPASHAVIGKTIIRIMILLSALSLVPFFVQFITVGLIPEGFSMAWNTPLLTMHIIANIVIGCSCISLGGAILYLGYKIGGTLMFSWAFVAVGFLTIGIGLTFFIMTATIWYPVYWIAAAIKYGTAIFGVGTAFAVPFVIPKILNFIHLAHLSEDHKSQLQEQNTDMLREITERKKAEERDRVHMRRLQAVIDGLPMGAAVLDEKETVLHLNAKVSELFAIDQDPKEFIGKSSMDVFRLLRDKVVDPDIYEQEGHDALRADASAVGREISLKDGRTLERDVIHVTADGKTQGRLLLYHDVTKQKRVDAAKSEFMSLASHQLRTPLTAIRWALRRVSNMLQPISSPPHVQEILQEAQAASLRMAHTIDTMLAISRLEAGEIHLEPQEIKVGALLYDVKQECRKEYERKEQHFTIDCQTHLLLYTDLSILKEILQNLFTNAIKYTPDRGSIHVHCAPLSKGVRITVKDSGYGIPPHQQKKIFQKFFRGDNIVGRDTEGTGLGLYMTSLLVRLLHGRITFVSDLQRGTTFTVDLFPLPSHVHIGPHSGR